jgi:hypothetical protein
VSDKRKAVVLAALMVTALAVGCGAVTVTHEADIPVRVVFRDNIYGVMCYGSNAYRAISCVKVTP